jgi:hypothetical protein
MRQYGAVTSPNAAANTPGVKSVTGAGTGGAAAVQTPDSGNYGSIPVYVGPSPSADIVIVITFPGTPPALFISGPPGFGVITQATNGNDVTITCTGHTLTPRSTPHLLAYEWANYLKAN